LVFPAIDIRLCRTAERVEDEQFGIRLVPLGTRDAELVDPIPPARLLLLPARRRGRTKVAEADHVILGRVWLVAPRRATAPQGGKDEETEAEDPSHRLYSPLRRESVRLFECLQPVVEGLLVLLHGLGGADQLDVIRVLVAVDLEGEHAVVGPFGDLGRT